MMCFVVCVADAWGLPALASGFDVDTQRRLCESSSGQCHKCTNLIRYVIYDYCRKYWSQVASTRLSDICIHFQDASQSLRGCLLGSLCLYLSTACFYCAIFASSSSAHITFLEDTCCARSMYSDVATVLGT